MKYGLEIGVSAKIGSDFEVRTFETLDEARAAYETTIPDEQQNGYVSLVELDSTGCPQRTLESKS